MGGGSVSPGTGEFNFAALESYLIEKGKVTKPLKGATLIGTGTRGLTKNFHGRKRPRIFCWHVWVCGGSVPVTVGAAI